MGTAAGYAEVSLSRFIREKEAESVQWLLRLWVPPLCSVRQFV